jgi:hypothetical protein
MIPKILNAKAIQTNKLEIQYENNISKVFPIEPYLKYTVYKPLQRFDFLKTVKVKYNTLVWGDDEMIDFDPYRLWMEGELV